MKYFVSCSFGKDSIATILLALENGEPLDGAVFSEVMFDHNRGISGENPEHIKWILEVAKPKLESMGCPIYIVKDNQIDYIKLFNQRRKKSKDPSIIGKKQGFLIGRHCAMTTKGKIDPIKKFYRKFKEPITQYIGIAIDEPNRLATMHKNKDRVSLLEKYNYTEQMAYDLCKKYDLLSPIYQNASRGGCWFCPNQSYKCLALLRKNHPDLWSELETLSKDPDTIGAFRYKESFAEVDSKLNSINV